MVVSMAALSGLAMAASDDWRIAYLHSSQCLILLIPHNLLEQTIGLPFAA
jgi:hypothetical protein